MVLLDPPPPARPPVPVVVDLPAGTRLIRIFDPDRRNTTAISFRWNGPRMRFDHQHGQGLGRVPSDDPERAVYYASWSDSPSEAFSSCLVEVFGDTGIVETANRWIAMPELSRAHRLLDLRGRGAMRAGTNAAAAKCPYHQSQPWSCHFYETLETYGCLDGLFYSNAHNDEPALVLYERAADGLYCPPGALTRLDHPELRPLLLWAMRANNLTF